MIQKRFDENLSPIFGLEVAFSLLALFCREIDPILDSFFFFWPSTSAFLGFLFVYGFDYRSIGNNLFQTACILVLRSHFLTVVSGPHIKVCF